MADLQGDQFDPGPVRILENGFIGTTSREFPARPQTTCRERILPPPEGPTVTGSTAGIVFFQHVHASHRFYLTDYIARRDGRLNLVAAMFFAHEMTHVWQWQNRERTGYHPTRAFAEHLRTADPYLFDGESENAFLDYGYEQQASLVEEFVCCMALDPDGARTARLRALLEEEMPVAQDLPLIEQVEVLVPWEGVERRGICS